MYKVRKNKEKMQGVMKETFKSPLNETNSEKAFSSSICNTIRSRNNSASGFIEKRKQKVSGQS